MRFHFLGVEFFVTNAAPSRADGGEVVGSGRSSGGGGSGASRRRRFIICETFCDLDLSAADGDAGYGAAVVAG
jgi:hypothetical protein